MDLRDREKSYSWLIILLFLWGVVLVNGWNKSERPLVDVDADYRQLRRRIINLVVKNPELMPAAMNTIQKGWRYVKRLFKDFGIS